MISNEMMEFAKELWPIPRSLTGDGVRATLNLIKKHLVDLKIYEVPSGTVCFDWKVPREWRVRSAILLDPNKQKIADFSENNLHLVGYSQPFNGKLNLLDLQEHLFSIPDKPKAIPYVTSYYRDFWGFCISDEKRKSLPPGEYEVKIDTELFDGSLTYGELVLPGESTDEILISTYVCHPSMANNELSGPVVTTYLAKSLLSQKRHYTYRFVFIPETIGSIVYISRNLAHLKKNVRAGFVLTCIGDEREFSILKTRLGDTYADRVAFRALEKMVGKKVVYSFLDRGSDERQYCSPGVDLPIASLMRSKYNTYLEYHNSLDNFDLVTSNGLMGGLQLAKAAVEIFESDEIYRAKIPCEPQLGNRGLYPTVSEAGTGLTVRNLMNVLSYCDSNHSLVDISNRIGISIEFVQKIIKQLSDNELIEKVKGETK